MTVRVRITFGVAVVFALALAVASLFLLARQRAALTSDIETTIRLRAADVVAALEGGSLPASIAIPFEDTSFVQIVDPSGNVVRSSPNIEGEPAVATFRPDRSHTAARTLHSLPIGDKAFRVVAANSASAGTSYTVYVGGSLEPVNDAVANLAVALALGAPALLAVVLALTWLAVGRALRPVEQMRAEVEAVNESALHRRVRQPPGDDEIGRLAATMNSMLARLEDATTRNRRFLADASHELRSPMAGIRSQLEVNLAHPDGADWQATEREVLDETLHMQRLVDDLLTLATLDEPATPARHTLLDLDDVVLGEVRRLRTRGKVAVDARDLSAAQTTGDTLALGRAFRNLLDNAERHAAETVTVSMADHGDEIRVVISDDGPGVAAADHDRIFERFARADESRSRDGGGRGLGLAIARDIIVAHGGTLVLEDSEVGATFGVRLPRATGPG
ncbi:MAG: ATP-binding protein [Chloroflexota bacterium]|nr:ATP-binding protein [Chloroflexota bacterium]